MFNIYSKIDRTTFVIDISKPMKNRFVFFLLKISNKFFIPFIIKISLNTF
jgi:hypothetical protein